MQVVRERDGSRGEAAASRMRADPRVLRIALISRQPNAAKRKVARRMANEDAVMEMLDGLQASILWLTLVLLSSVWTMTWIFLVFKIHWRTSRGCH